MIEMRVMGIALDTRSGSPIVVLNDAENRIALPIWIGSAEASSIIRKIENIPSSRPMTHDLFIDIFNKTEFKLEEVRINDVTEETYYSSLVLKNKDGKIAEIDARPSDAIAIAIRAQVPIYVSPEVISKGGITTNTQRDEQEALEFKNFIKDIKPSDFEKMINKNFETDQ
ncbi:MAG: bifunctional nuclease family protein [Cyanobacteria bacterium SIG30]|nr:bifunctional nuclease family protein [Cyanobacteria bacterium SIG30]